MSVIEWKPALGQYARQAPSLGARGFCVKDDKGLPEDAAEGRRIATEDARGVVVCASWHPGQQSLPNAWSKYVVALQPEAALADSSTVDITQPYHPFGTFPQTGARFYFTFPEPFSKP